MRSLIAQCYLPALAIWLAQGEDHQLCGFIGLTANHVEMLFIDAPARGKGIGRWLLDHAVALCGELTLDVDDRNPQDVSFYQRYGFIQTGRAEVDAQGNPFPILHMQWNKR